MKEALEMAGDDDTGESQEEVYQVDSFEILEAVSRDKNKIQYAVNGTFGGAIRRKGKLCTTWMDALNAYLGEFPTRQEALEVLVLTMSVNGADAEPVWEEELFDYVSDNGIEVRSIRDPRDPSTIQLVRS